MQRPSQLSSKERKILWIYVLSGIGLIVLLILLGLARSGLPISQAPTGQAEIAVLVPLRGEQAVLGQAVFDTVKKAALSPVSGNVPSSLQINVKAYDTSGTPDGAASAARKAARNPATAAFIGPLDAREVAAAMRVISDEGPVLITPSSTAPKLDPNQTAGLFRIPAPDDIQGQAIVEFVNSPSQLGLTDIYLIAEPSSYAQGILESFNPAAQNRLKIAGALNLGQEGIPADLLQKIADSKAEAVVYLGGISNARTILNGMNAADMELPFVSSDSLNDPSLLPLEGDKVPVYYASPILSGGVISGTKSLENYQKILGEAIDTPFAYETIQATWLVMGSLAGTSPRLTPRKSVWQNLGRSRIPGFGDEMYSLGMGQLSPSHIYIYQVAGKESSWALNRLVYTYERR